MSILFINFRNKIYSNSNRSWPAYGPGTDPDSVKKTHQLLSVWRKQLLWKVIFLDMLEILRLIEERMFIRRKIAFWNNKEK